MKTLKQLRDEMEGEIASAFAVLKHPTHKSWRMASDDLWAAWTSYKLATDALYATIDRNLSEASATLTAVLGGIIIQKAIAPDGPPGVDMEIQREAAMWRWVRSALAGDPPSRKRLMTLCTGLRRGIDPAKTVGFCIDNPDADDAMILKFLSDNQV